MINYRQTNREVYAELQSGLPYANPEDLSRLAAMITMRIVRAYHTGKEEIEDDFDTQVTSEFLVIEVEDFAPVSSQDSRMTVDLGPSVTPVEAA